LEVVFFVLHEALELSSQAVISRTQNAAIADRYPCPTGRLIIDTHHDRLQAEKFTRTLATLTSHPPVIVATAQHLHLSFGADGRRLFMVYMVHLDRGASVVFILASQRECGLLLDSFHIPVFCMGDGHQMMRYRAEASTSELLSIATKH
jgi:hypothetical protein